MISPGFLGRSEAQMFCCLPRTRLRSPGELATGPPALAPQYTGVPKHSGLRFVGRVTKRLSWKWILTQALTGESQPAAFRNVAQTPDTLLQGPRRPHGTTHHLVQELKSKPVCAFVQRMAVRISTVGLAAGSGPSRDGDHSPPISTDSSAFFPRRN